jgi:hypothetical protein
MRIPIALVAALAVLTCFRAWAEDPAAADAIFKKLLAAQAGKDYNAFVAVGTTQLKAALSKTQFEASSDVLNARFTGGYESTLLGELNMRGCEVYLYRLRFKDDGDDILGTLSLKNGKVAGIYFH